MANGTNKNQQNQPPPVTDPRLKLAMSFPAFANEAQAYGLTPQQYGSVLQQTQQPVGWGAPTAYGQQGQQEMPNVAQQGNIQTLQALTNMGINPQQQQQTLQQALQQQQSQQPTMQQLWQQYMNQGARGAQAQPSQATVAPAAPIAPYGGTALQTQSTPYASVPTATPGLPAATPWLSPQPSIQQTDPQQFMQGQAPIRMQSGGFVPDPSQSQDGQGFNLSSGYMNPQYQPGLMNPLYSMSAMGAAALGGMPMIANWNPTMGGDLSKGGVVTGQLNPKIVSGSSAVGTGTAPSAVTPGVITLPNGAQLSQAQAIGFQQYNPADQASYAKNYLGGASAQDVNNAIAAASGQQGISGGQGYVGPGGAYGGYGGQGQGGQGAYGPNAQPQYVSNPQGMPAGPWNRLPGLFVAQQRPIATGTPGGDFIPAMPPNMAQARPGGQGTPWATAPPAPGVSFAGGGMGVPGQGIPGQMGGGMGTPEMMMAHTSALADAGRALYAHYGGDPDTATSGDIANFHSQLINAATNYTAGAATTGGRGAGGSGDAGATALRTGETKEPVKAHSGGLVPGRGNTDSVPALLTPGEYVLNRQQAAQLFGGRTPIRMQSGGPVPDPNEPPEVPRQPLTVPTAGNQQASPQTQPAPAQTSSAPAPASPAAQSYPGYPSAAAGRAALTSGGASGGGYNIPGGYIGASPGPGQSGYAYPNQAAATAAGDVGTGVRGVGPSGQQIGSAASGLMSGLSKAAQTYADSVKPWQMLPNEIPQPPKTQAAPVQLAQQAPPY